MSISHPVRSRSHDMSKAFSAPLRNVTIVPVAFLCCALAACGTVVSPPGAHTGTTKAASSPGSGMTPRQRATADAAAILAAFVPPSAAIRLTSAPVTGGAGLLDPVFREDTPVLLVIGAGQHSTGRPGPQETGLGFGSEAAEKALAISGMNWKLFGYLPG